MILDHDIADDALVLRRSAFGSCRKLSGVFAFLCWLGPAAAEPLEEHGPPFVCADVVVAIDGSESTRERGFERQIRTLEQAFRHADLHRALQDCLPGSIGLALMTWSGPGQQGICLPPHVISNANECALASFKVAQCRYFGGTTDIGAALDRAVDLLDASTHHSFYRVVLLLTNGRTDRGSEERLARARVRAAERGVTVVGHGLIRKTRGALAAEPGIGPHPFHRYVERHVTTGPRAFTSSSDRTSDAPVVLDTLIRILRQELH